MMAKLNKGLALLVAIGLGIGEAVMNWGNWQYAPLWIVDYIIVAWLLAGIVATTGSAHVLIGAWAFSLGVMYMALAFATDPANRPLLQVGLAIKSLIGLLVAVSAAGLALSFVTAHDRAGHPR